MSEYKRMAELVRTHQLDEALPLIAPLIAGVKAVGGAVARKVGGSLVKKVGGSLVKKLNPTKLLKKGAGRMPNKFSGKSSNINITTPQQQHDGEEDMVENLYSRMADLLMESKADRRARKRENQGKPISPQAAVAKAQQTIRANAPKPKGPSLGARLRQFGRDKVLPRLRQAGAGALVGAGMAGQAAGGALGRARDKVSPVVSRAASGAATGMKNALARAITSPPTPKVTSTIGATPTAAPTAPKASPAPVNQTRQGGASGGTDELGNPIKRPAPAPAPAPSKPSEPSKPAGQPKLPPIPSTPVGKDDDGVEQTPNKKKKEKDKPGFLQKYGRLASAIATAEKAGLKAGPLDINN